MKWVKRTRLAGAAVLASAAILGSASVAAGEILFTIPGNAAAGNIDIFLTSGTATSATIANSNGTFNQTVAIPANGTAIVTINNALRIGTLGLASNNGFSITSAGAIAAYLMDANIPVQSNDITNLFPTDSLGTSYRVMAGTSNLVPAGSQMSFVASADGTTVTVTPSATLTTGQAAGVPFTVNLNNRQAMEFRAAGTSDLTGTTIVSNNKIAVFGGHFCGNVPANVAFCDHLIEQMPKTSDFGTQFVLMPTNQGGPGEVLKILAIEGGTVVTLNDGGVISTINLNAGQSFESAPTINDRGTVTSNNPILVGQFMIGQQIAGNGDPAFSLVPDVTKWLKEYIFNVPVGNYNDFLGVAIESAALGSLMLDGVLVNPALFAAVPGTTFMAGNIPVADGSHRILASDEFMLLGSGFNNNFASYFGIGGSSISGGGVTPPPPPNGTPEPGTLALFGVSLAALHLLRRRRSTG